MAHFKFAYNTSKGQSQPREHDIAAATAIEKGEIIKKTAGLVVAVGDTDSDDPYLGVAAEPHDGATSGRQSGTKIKIYDNPDDVFAYVPRVACTATGGTTSTILDTNLQFASDDMLNGGYVQILNCQADSSLNGKKIKISDYTQSSGTIALAETQPVAFAAGDTFYLCPGTIAKGSYNWDMNSDGTDIDWEDTSAGEAIRIEDVDPETFTVFFKFRLHLNGNYPIAVP